MRNRATGTATCLLVVLAGCSSASAATPSPNSATSTPMPATSLRPTPAPTPNRVTASIDVGGVTREYTVVTPPDVSNRVQLPLLLVLHGAEQTMQVIESYGFDVAALESGAVVVYPQGEKDPERPGRQGYIWNSGQTDTGFDDVAFVRALLDRMEADYPIDPGRVFIEGASNGGQMAYRAACELSDRIAAVGDISGTLLVDCQPSSPVSVIDLRGMADPIWTPPAGGGQGCKPLDCPPLAVTQETWRRIDGCTGDPTMIQIAPTSVETEWTTCEDGTAVAFIRAANADHFMDGVDFDFVRLIWAFLNDHPRSGGSTS